MSETTAGTYAPGITVVVPTYRRTAELEHCLAALEQQSLPPTEILICYREEDAETVAFLARTDRTGLSARLLLCERPGQVFALTRGIDAATTDYVAITDDDSIPIKDWLRKIVDHFESDATVGGVGGRDYVWADGQWMDGAEQVVGIVKWNGVAIGNHHVGAGPARYVHVLKGVNMSYRKSALGDLRPDTRLRGKGVQMGNDMMLSLSLVARGYHLIYDPAVLVEHHVGQRPAEEHRVLFNPVGFYDVAYNRHLTTMEYLASQPHGRLRQIAYRLTLTLLGSRRYPGVIHLLYGLLTRDENVWTRFRLHMKSIRDGIAAAKRR